ncbi:EGF-like domain-containing protein [Tieghemostelium lacteum]|uniref:EGF-like domain-containing protein n=1 Tax=Tieghemostelium lacteum TaxID=361077 RepID=A0A151Z7Y9_TIELA|nr:EGF-like domain-containing protein [Tieghemostelium lacteum]|eukprot:KYQ90048.1 EGF-like domain-containing protein [Tieghemostelium lacteum]
MINIKNYLFLFILLLLCINLSNSYILKEVLTPYGSNEVYADQDDFCYFKWQIHVEDEQGDMAFDGAAIGPSIETGVLNFEVQIGDVGNHTVGSLGLQIGIRYKDTIQLTMFGVDIKNGIVSYDCQKIPPLQILNDVQWLNSGSFYYTHLRFNLKKKFQLDGEGIVSFNIPYLCTFKVYGFDIMAIKCHLENVYSYVIPPLNITIRTGLAQSFYIDSFIKNEPTPLSYSSLSYSDSEVPNVAYKSHYFLPTVGGQGGHYVSSTMQKYTAVDMEYSTISEMVLGNQNDITMLLYTYFTSVDLITIVNFTTSIASNGFIETPIQATYPFPDYPLQNPLEFVSGTENTVNSTTLYEYSVDIKGYYDFYIIKKIQDFRLYDPIRYPNGMISYSSLNNVMRTTFVLYVSEYFSTTVLALDSENIIFNQETGSIDDISGTTLTGLVEFIPLKGCTMLIRAQAASGSGILKIFILGNQESEISLLPHDLVEGDIKNGIFQKYLDYTDIYQDGYFFNVYPMDHQGFIFTFDHEINVSPFQILPFKFPNIPEPSEYEQNTNRINYVAFLVEECDLSEINCENIMFINFTQPNPILSVKVVLKLDKDISFFARWNKNFNMYTGDFVLEPRAFSGVVPYVIYYNSMEYLHSFLPDSGQLKIKTQYADRMPPLITRLDRSGAIEQGTGGQIDWTFYIEEQYNGLKYAKVFITTDKNPFVPLVFDYVPESQQLSINPVFSINITIPPQCIAQSFRISYVELVDNSGAKSVYNNLTYIYQEFGKKPFVDPFMKILDNIDLPINRTIGTDCGVIPSTDLVPPSIVSVTFSPEFVDVSSSNRHLEITFNITDTNSKVITYITPTCYLYAGMFKQTESKSTLVSATDGNSTATFSCAFDLPFGFGYPEGKVYLGIYGYTDSSLNFGGSSPNNIIEAGLTNYFDATFSQTQPVITSVLPIDEDGELTIIGHNFGSERYSPEVPKVNVTYESSTSIHNATFYEHVILVIKPVPNQVIKNVTIILNNHTSNNYIDGNGSGQPVVTPICPGTPQCGGPTNGLCTSFGCKCSEGWSGFDCLSKVVIITPTINNTNPTIDNEIPLPNGETATLRSLINILSLREIKIDGTIVADHKFDTWYFRNLSLPRSTIQEFQYTSGLTNNGKVTNITVNIQYFTQEQSIVFANEVLDMKPSTIKYKISLNHYEFTSNLNSLELMMTATFESNNIQSSCTSQEQGSLIDNGTDFVKLQLNENSLYARFVKRAIIDNRVQSVSNTFYNSTTTTVQEQTATSISNLIGIKIPNYRFNALLDPDFSVLLDTKPVTSDSSPNSMCSESKNKGLTKAQLAGIIIGCIGFGLIVAISVVYYIYKTKQYKNTQIKLQKKMEEFK